MHVPCLTSTPRFTARCSHFVSDEIYGNSVWGEGEPEFESAEVLGRCDPRHDGRGGIRRNP